MEAAMWTKYTLKLSSLLDTGCFPFGESKNGFLILDLPDFSVERNVKSEIGFVTLVTFRQRVQYARQPLKNDVFSTVWQIMRLYRAEFSGRQFE